jgi:hypothetical protein
VPGIIHTVTYVNEFVLMYAIAAAIVLNEGPFIVAIESFPLMSSTTSTRPNAGVVAEAPPEE